MLRDREDESGGVIRRLFNGERVDREKRIVHAAGSGAAKCCSCGIKIGAKVVSHGYFQLAEVAMPRYILQEFRCGAPL